MNHSLSGSANASEKKIKFPLAVKAIMIDLDGTLSEAMARVAAEVERRKIIRAIRDAGGDRARAADMLQVGYKALHSKMKDLGIDADARG